MTATEKLYLHVVRYIEPKKIIVADFNAVLLCPKRHFYHKWYRERNLRKQVVMRLQRIMTLSYFSKKKKKSFHRYNEQTAAKNYY